MYILTKEEIQKVCDDLNNLDDYLDEIMYDPDKVEEALGDAPFEFEDILITNPLRNEAGMWIGSYEKACDYYGEENVNRYFGKYIAHNFGYEPNIEEDTIIEELKSSDQPIYEDNDFKIYHYQDIHKLYSNTNISNLDIDMGSYSDGDYYILASKDKGDDDFVVDDSIVVVLDVSPSEIYVYSDEIYDPYSSYSYQGDTRDLDDLWYFLEKNYKDTYEFVKENILKNIIYSKLNISDDKINDKADLSDINIFIGLPKGSKLDSLTDILSGTTSYDLSYLYDYDFLENISDDITNDNLNLLSKKFNIPEDKLKEVIDKKTNEDIYDLLSTAYLESVEQNYIEQLMVESIQIIKNCFPEDMRDYISVDNENIYINNCPKNIYSKLIDEFIDYYITREYLAALYTSKPIEIYSFLLRKNLKTDSLENINPEFDSELFNEILADRL